MNPTRRSFLVGAGLLGLSGGLSACGASDSGPGSSAGSKDLSLWYWDGGLSPQAVKDTSATFSGRAKITTTVVPGDFKQRLKTAFTSRQDIPDITGIKGEDMPVFLTETGSFLDLNTLGARTIADSFATAKYAQATTADGQQIGLPIDLGPTALFFRADLWKKAGLPVAPGAVSALMTDWDGWFDTARRLKKALPGTFAIRNSGDVFGVALAQQHETFVARDGSFIGDQGGAKKAWKIALRSITDGIQAGIYNGSAFSEALTSGQLTGHIGPAWNGLDIEAGAPSTSGAWRVASCPGGPGNIGGSYLTLPGSCRNPELAFAYITELLSAANQSKGFAEASLFPALTAAYTLPALTAGQTFYGGQSTIEVFGPAAEHLPTVYDSPLNITIATSYNTELSNVEGGKEPAKAWKDAIEAGAEVVRSAA
jgi:cellobiose transport system substrate-binding protein